MARSGFKMKGSPMQRNFGIGGSPMRDEKVKRGKTFDEVGVAEKKLTYEQKGNVRMTKSELRDAKINPKEGVTYYRNTKTGQITSATSAPTTYKKPAPTKRTGGIQHFTTKERIH